MESDEWVTPASSPRLHITHDLGDESEDNQEVRKQTNGRKTKRLAVSKMLNRPKSGRRLVEDTKSYGNMQINKAKVTAFSTFWIVAKE